MTTSRKGQILPLSAIFFILRGGPRPGCRCWPNLNKGAAGLAGRAAGKSELRSIMLEARRQGWRARLLSHVEGRGAAAGTGAAAAGRGRLPVAVGTVTVPVTGEPDSEGWAAGAGSPAVGQRRDSEGIKPTTAATIQCGVPYDDYHSFEKRSNIFTRPCLGSAAKGQSPCR